MRTALNDKQSRRGESGQAVVEFAIVAGVLLLVIAACVQFAKLYSHYVQITDATRVGARTAAVSRATCPGNTVQRVRDSAANLDQAQLNVTVTPCPWTAGGQVQVTATYPWSISLVGIAVASGTLSSTTKERVE